MKLTAQVATPPTVTSADELPAAVESPQEIQAKEIVAQAGELAKIVESARERCQHIEDGRGFVERARTEVEANATGAKKLLAEVTESHTRCAELRTQMEAAAKAIVERGAQVDSQAASIGKVAESSAKAEEQVRATQQQVDSARQNSASIDEANRLAGSATSELQSKVTTAGESLKSITEHATRSQEQLGTITSISAQVAQLKAQAETDSARTKGIADVAADTEQKVRAYEERVAGFDDQFRSLRDKIESLFFLATSTGLAEAFRVRKEQFRWPHRIWNAVFVVCLVFLVSLYAFAFGTLTDIKTAPSPTELGFGLLQRLPFAIVLVWLALHAARQASIFKRIEEDYAFKEVVSRSFEGYKREMLAIDPTLPPQSVAHQLCSNFLRIVSMSPGRLYESKYRDPTPFSAVGETAIAVSEAMKKTHGLSA